MKIQIVPHREHSTLPLVRKISKYRFFKNIWKLVTALCRQNTELLVSKLVVHLLATWQLMLTFLNMHFGTVSILCFRVKRKVQISCERFISSPDGNDCCIKIMNLKKTFWPTNCTILPSCCTLHESEESKRNRTRFSVFSSASSCVLLKKLLLNIWTEVLIKMCPKIVLNGDKKD
jgi:hypothetical protein